MKIEDGARGGFVLRILILDGALWRGLARGAE
jgi:hypothetical protein